MGTIRSSIAFLSVLYLALAFPLKAQQAPISSQLEFHSSDARLNQSFHWAKEQALAYAHPESSPIGAWYEAALPGRDAFCMRDVSHQTTGAAVLGLFRANRNILGRFAEAVSKQRDWAGYWEIDNHGKPSQADYVSDSDFWYNLPANFDVLDAIVRMWKWTGDNSYRDDKRIQEFFHESLTDYIDRWQLAPDAILKRPRIANQRQSEGRFVQSRGIPSYIEGPKDFIFGTDLLAAEYRTIRSYKEIAAAEGDEQFAARLQATADQLQHLLETTSWSSTQRHFNSVIHRDQTGSGSGDTMALYFDAVRIPAHIQGALAYISDPSYWKKVNIEEESYVPLVLFRYGRSAAAYRVLFDLSSSNKPRREYPEVSYAVVAAIVTGAMGIEPAKVGSEWGVRTLPQPMNNAEMLSVGSLQIRGNVVNVTHNGEESTRFENREGSCIRWQAAFKGAIDLLYVDGKPERATQGSLGDGSRISWVLVSVKPGASTTVSRRMKAQTP